MGFKYAYGAAPGTHHSKKGVPCQDSYILRTLHAKDGEPVLVIVVSDGAGSAKYGELGSKLACAVVVEEIKEYLEFENSIESFTRDTFLNMVTSFQEEAEKYADVFKADIKDFACTIIAAVVGVKQAAFFQIGDGAIVISARSRPGIYIPVFWPQKGEYENTTYFAVNTKSQEKYMDSSFMGEDIDEIAVFTDGLQRLALHYQTKTAYTPFFSPLFSYLKLGKDTSPNKLIDSLNSFLNSKRVNDRTDDDKTLILAVRCGD